MLSRAGKPPGLMPSRTYPETPVLAVAAILVHQGRVLLIRRGQPPARGLWTLPGGGVETGEPVRAALVREIREETGLDIRPGPLVEIFEVIERDAAGRIQYHFVILDFLAQCQNPDPALAASDAAALAWVGWNELNGLATTPGLAGVLAKARRVAEGAGSGRV